MRKSGLWTCTYTRDRGSGLLRTTHDTFTTTDFASPAFRFLSVVDTRPEQQLQVLELIVDRATSETRKLQRCNGENNTEEQQQVEGKYDGDRLGDVLVAAFQLAASQLVRCREERGPDAGTRQLLRWSEQVIDTLWAAGAEDGESMDQRLLWRELLCRCWDEVAASLALEMLLLRAQVDTISGKVVSTQAGATLRVVAFAYARFPVTLQEFCINQVAELVRVFIDEGPLCLFTPRMILQLQLLEHLSAVHFLADSDDLDVTEWIDELFPECFECCGVVLQLLNEQPGDEKAEGWDGMVGLLDMCLLMLKAGFDYFETRRDDVSTLLKILTPTIVAALSQLATRPVVSAEANNASASAEISEARSLETSLYLLARLGAVVEADKCGALIKIFEKLLAPSMASNLFAARPTLLPMCFEAVDQLLAHPNVAEIMGPSLTTLLQVSDLKALHAHYVITGQIRNFDVVEIAHQRAPTCFTKNQLRSENDTAPENPESVASLLSGMDLGDTKCPDKLVVEDRTDGVDELHVASDQPRVAVLRPDVPQWFVEEDSSDEGSGAEAVVLHVPLDESDKESDRGKCVRTDTAIPQWFDDADDEEEADIELPECALEGSSDDPELSALLLIAPAMPEETEALDRLMDVDVESDDGSTSTEIASWSDCSRSSSEWSRSSSLASLPS